MSDAALPIVIVGAGIAGLTTALALTRRGRDVVIIERAERLSEVGAGIQLSPNASRILLDLGLADALAACGVEPTGIEIRSGAHGRTVATLPLGDRARRRWGAPYVVIHRGDLQAALLAAVDGEQRIELRLGCSPEDVRERGNAIEVDVRTGAVHSTITAAALIGADGVRSTVRTRMLGGPAATFSGRTAWRATFPTAAWAGSFDVEHATGLWLGARTHLVHYPIRAGREINVVAIVEDDRVDERWDTVGESSDLLRAFHNWPASAKALLRMPEAWRTWALATVRPETTWTKGRVALAGDAAHAMLPFAAQGGAMAIEDAAVLARLLTAGEGAMADRIAAYEQLRRPRAAAVARVSRRNDTVYHLGGAAASLRDIAMTTLGPSRLIGRMDWIYRWRDDA